METREYLARRHQEVVDEFIEAVLDEMACDMGDLERNIVGVALRQEVETRLVPGLLAVHSLLLGVDGETLARLPGWLGCVQTPMPSDAGFFTEMGRLLDPEGGHLLEENSGLLPGESEASRAFTGYLWSMAPGISSRPVT